MTWGAVAGVASAVIGAGTAVYSSRKASQIGSQAAGMADPFAENRGLFAQKLMDNWDMLTSTDPQKIMQDPQFQFLKSQGLGAIGAGSAAAGSFNSGGKLTKGAEFATGLASQFLDKQFQQRQQILGLLGQYSGATTGNPGQAGQLYGYGQSASLNYLNQGVGNTLALLNRVPWGNFGGGDGSGATNAAAGTSGAVLRPPAGWGG